jgi:hypothetical protein
MLSFFRKPKKKGPTKNSSFYHRENAIQNTDELKKVFEVMAPTKTKNKILFQGISLDNIFLKTIEKQFGEESSHLDRDEEIFGHKVYFYRKTVENYTLLMQLHFINEVFFMACTKISSESSLLTTKDKQKIILKLLNHFPDIETTDNSFEYRFSDPDGNVIFTEDNVFLYINYYANNEAVRNMKKIAESTIFAEKPKDIEEETLDNFL